MLSDELMADAYFMRRLAQTRRIQGISASIQFDLARAPVSDDELDNVATEFGSPPSQGWGTAEVLHEMLSAQPTSIPTRDLLALQHGNHLAIVIDFRQRQVRNRRAQRLERSRSPRTAGRDRRLGRRWLGCPACSRRRSVDRRGVRVGALSSARAALARADSSQRARLAGKSWRCGVGCAGCASQINDQCGHRPER